MLFFHHLALINFLIFITYTASLLTNTKTLNICSNGNNECCIDESRKSSPRPCRTNFGLFFKKKQEGECNDSSENHGFLSSVWKGIKRFVPDITKAKIEKSYEVPQTEGGYRYHIRLVGSNVNNRRHVITRILRYFPDITWETAADIVDTAVFDGKALVRVLNSLSEATYCADMLRKADPPIQVELYDSKRDEILFE